MMCMDDEPNESSTSRTTSLTVVGVVVVDL